MSVNQVFIKKRPPLPQVIKKNEVWVVFGRKELDSNFRRIRSCNQHSPPLSQATCVTIRRSWPKPVWILPPPTPSRPTRAHLPITARTKPFSMKERCLLCSDSEILEQTSSTSSLGTLSFYLQKSVGPSLVRNLPCSTCVTSVPIHWQFFQYCYLRLFMFSLMTQSSPRVCGYYWPSWPFLPFVNK